MLQGEGIFPDTDPWGNKFSPSYERSRFENRGKSIAGGFLGVLSGIRGDQAFLKSVFTLKRCILSLRRQICFFVISID